MKKKLPNNIFMTADTLGGVWNYSLSLAGALGEDDIHIHLATMGKKLSKAQWKSASKIENLTIYESEFALEWMDNPWQDVDKASIWLLELVDEIQPDLIHLNNYAHGVLEWPAPVLIVNHSCVLSWWKAVLGNKAPERLHEYEHRVKSGLQSADMVVSITQSMLENLQDLYGPLRNTEVIYNGCDAKEFKSGEKKNVIFSMGRLWDEAKNVACLQKIAPQLPWPVVVAGSDNGKVRNNQPENFNLAGLMNQEQVKKQLAETSIYVMPARYEPFGLSILEAALSGCALVLGDIPTLRELWNDAALFADPEQPLEVRYEIEKLINNTNLRRQMARKAMERAKNYSIRKMKKSYLNLYARLLQSEQKSASLTV